MAPKVVIIADDLTGALDSAVAFAVRGLSVIGARGPEYFAEALGAGADIVALATGTREYAPDSAKAVLSEIGERLRDYNGIIFKKIDSRMKGNVLAEVETLTGLRSGPALVCPAIPRLGRLVENGAIVGAGVASPIEVAPFFGSLAVEVFDAKTDADVDRAVGGATDKQLYVGAAGLAEALARHLAPTPKAGNIPKLALPATLAIGSRDPVTTGQVAALETANVPLSISKAPNGILGELPNEANGISVLQITPGEDEIGTSEAAGIFANHVAAHVRRTHAATLFLCGGESANAILADLGIGTLQITAEILPGVPCAKARDGVPGLSIVTKSGGFGDKRALIDLCALLLAE